MGCRRADRCAAGELGQPADRRSPARYHRRGRASARSCPRPCSGWSAECRGPRPRAPQRGVRARAERLARAALGRPGRRCSPPARRFVVPAGVPHAAARPRRRVRAARVLRAAPRPHRCLAPGGHLMTTTDVTSDFADLRPVRRRRLGAPTDGRTIERTSPFDGRAGRQLRQGERPRGRPGGRRRAACVRRDPVADGRSTGSCDRPAARRGAASRARRRDGTPDQP